MKFKIMTVSVHSVSFNGKFSPHLSSGGYHETFYQLFLEDEVLSNQAQIGVTMAVGTFSEMMIMLCSGKILQYIKQVFEM